MPIRLATASVRSLLTATVSAGSAASAMRARRSTVGRWRLSSAMVPSDDGMTTRAGAASSACSR